MGDTCSICGNAPALCVDPDDKGTYFLCHSCAVENVMSGILLQAALEQRVEALEKVLLDISTWTDFHELPSNWDQVTEDHARQVDDIVSDVKLAADKALAAARERGEG